MLLRRTSALARRAMDQEEQRCAQNRHVLTEVQTVLDEMVYDVESCEHECEVTRLRRQLTAAEGSLVEYQERESELIQERQQAYEYALKVEQDGRDIVAKLNENLAIVVGELTKKEVMEKELTQAKEQLKLAGQLSKELAGAQREIRELRRTNDIQYLLRGKAITGRPPATEARIPLPPRSGGIQARASTSTAAKRQQSPLVSVTSPTGNVFSEWPDKLLMNVFAFLDANSVFAVSSTDRALMTRVNELFGLESPVTVAAVSGNHRKAVSAASPKPPVVSPPVREPLMKRSLSFISASSEKDKLSKVDMIVKSLKPEQIKLFHDMSTRVKTMETHLAQVQAEREDIAQRLSSAEDVRDFLMEKLKDLEDTLSNSIATSAKKDEQAGMDREIIGFLDAKTQEYETALKEYAKQNAGLRVEISQMHEESASRTTIMEDMVELLTQEKKELELQLRSQRKVLVREVKVLRATNQQLETEKDHYFTQLKHLKRALQHLDELN